MAFHAEKGTSGVRRTLMITLFLDFLGIFLIMSGGDASCFHGFDHKNLQSYLM